MGSRRKYPHLILVIGNNRKYTWTSSQIVKLMLQFIRWWEVFSIDEAFLDVSGSIRLFGSADRIAYLLKAQIRHHFGITCSIGIAPNKLLAKLASEMEKPDGLTIIRPGEVSPVLERMPVKELCGIGSKTARQLALYGIRTCGELGRFPVDILRKRFGIIGERLHRMGRGVDDSPVIPAEEANEVKSVGHSMTLERDIEDRKEILKFLLQLSRWSAAGRGDTKSGERP
jgi:DNA polymerase-4